MGKREEETPKGKPGSGVATKTEAKAPAKKPARKKAATKTEAKAPAKKSAPKKTSKKKAAVKKTDTVMKEYRKTALMEAVEKATAGATREQLAEEFGYNLACRAMKCARIRESIGGGK